MAFAFRHGEAPARRWTALVRHRRARGQRGAVLVEFAFVAPLLFLILFGIIEFGYNLNIYQAVRQGVREGARQAVVNNTSNGSCTTSPTISNASAKSFICATKSRIADVGGVTSSNVRVEVRVQQPATPGPSDYGQLVICAEYPMTSFTGFFKSLFNNKYMESRVQMRNEVQLSTTDFPANATTTVGETDPSGGSWSWCTTPS